MVISITFSSVLSLYSFMSTGDFSGNIWKEIPNTPYYYAHDPLSRQAGNSTVHLCKAGKHPPFSLLAIKFFNGSEKPNKLIADLIGLRMRHVINFHVLNLENPSFVIMELGGKNLREATLRKKFYLSSEETLQLAFQLLFGIKQLKNQGIIHCDIKPQNIIEVQDQHFKLCDLDFSMKFKETDKSIRVGTLLYMAPQILDKGTCSYQSDIWSLGIVLYELYFGHFPWRKPSFDSNLNSKVFLEYNELIKKQLGKIEEELTSIKVKSDSKETIMLLDLISSCLVLEPTKRKTIDELFFLISKKKSRKSSVESLFKPIQKDEEQLLEMTKSGVLIPFIKIQQHFQSLPPNDLLIRKGSTLLSIIGNIVETINNQQKLSLKLIRESISKITLQSRKISELIRNNLKRLGLTPVTGIIQQKKELAEYLQVTNSYLLSLDLEIKGSQTKLVIKSVENLP